MLQASQARQATPVNTEIQNYNFWTVIGGQLNAPCIYFFVGAGGLLKDLSDVFVTILIAPFSKTVEPFLYSPYIVKYL